MNIEIKDQILFRGRFLLLYVVFGSIAILIEFSFRHLFLKFNLDDNYATLIGIFMGILFAYWSNIKFNFQIPNHRLKKVFYLFLLISISSKVMQQELFDIFYFENLNYESKRLISSAMVFIIVYLINLKITFRSNTKIGIAIYANNEEDIGSIYKKIGQKPDFIQVDIVDKTISKNFGPYNLDVIREVKKYWPEKFIELHIMSLNPQNIINELGNLFEELDLFLIHEDCEAVFESIRNRIKNSNKKFGIFFRNTTSISKIKKYSYLCDQITLMGIEQLGVSGQKFVEKTYEVTDQVEKFENRSKFLLEIDGGVNSSNYFNLKVDKLVSASAILTANNPLMKISEFKRM